MTSVFQGLPIQHELNLRREQASKDTYDDKKSIGARVAHFVIHKEFAVFCIFANVAGTGIGATGVGCSIALAVPKIVIFVGSAGHVKPTYSTGFLYSGEVTLSSITNIFCEIFEIAYDGGYIIYKCGEGVHWTAKRLGFEGTLKRIAKETFRLMEEGARRVGRGAERAASHEPSYTSGSPVIVAWINDPTQSMRIDFSGEERSIVDIFGHTLFSVGNIPVNTFACVASGIIAVPLSACFILKVGVNSITNLDTPLPTYAGAAWVTCGKTGFNVVADAGTAIADVGILGWKGARALYIDRVAMSTFQALAWCLSAIIS